MASRRGSSGRDASTTTARSRRDGKYLSVTSGDTGDLAVVELATGETRNLTDGGGFEHGLVEFSAPSSDGQRFAYSWYEPKNSSYELRLIPEVWVLSAEKRALIAFLRALGSQTP